jgi:uncharacterized protein YndB with AHSA1/START domain
MTTPSHVYEIFVKATPERVWQAITDPDYTRRYFHRTAVESAFRRGAGVRYVTAAGETAVEGEVQIAEPGRRLVMTWHPLYDPEIAAEPVSHVEWVLSPADDAGEVTRVTLRHTGLAASPRTWDSVRLGWVVVLDGLKTLLETGEPLTLGVLDTSALPVDDVEGVAPA